MNTQAVAFALVSMVALASGLGYDRFKTRSHLGLGNSWDLLGSRGLGGSWGLGGSLGLGGGHWGNSRISGISHGRYRRAAVRYGSYNPIGHFGGLRSGFLGNRRIGGLGFNSRFNTFGRY